MVLLRLCEVCAGCPFSEPPAALNNGLAVQDAEKCFVMRPNNGKERGCAAAGVWNLVMIQSPEDIVICSGALSADEPLPPSGRKWPRRFPSYAVLLLGFSAAYLEWAASLYSVRQKKLLLSRLHRCKTFPMGESYSVPLRFVCNNLLISLWFLYAFLLDQNEKTAPTHSEEMRRRSGLVFACWISETQPAT